MRSRSDEFTEIFDVILISQTASEKISDGENDEIYDQRQ
jgi:hypothetical protein